MNIKSYILKHQILKILVDACSWLNLRYLCSQLVELSLQLFSPLVWWQLTVKESSLKSFTWQVRKENVPLLVQGEDYDYHQGFIDQETTILRLAIVFCHASWSKRWKNQWHYWKNIHLKSSWVEGSPLSAWRRQRWSMIRKELVASRRNSILNEWKFKWRY